MRFQGITAAVLACAPWSSDPVRAQADSLTLTLPSPPVVAPTHTAKHFWRAAGGVMAINTFVWGVDYFVMRAPWARVGTRSWESNFRQGFGWDDNRFQVNQLGHPYHGSLYFGVARANGYTFWEATPFPV